MKKITHPLLGETVYWEVLPCSMPVFFMPKKGFTHKYAVFATNYGSIDLNFTDPHSGEKRQVTPGIAHFLEHKVFEQPDGTDAFEVFSQYGANANAFTNFNMTAYLFSTSEGFYPCLEHLLRYVQTPYFTKENVEKEKGIIEQEIRMYEDNPDWKVFFNALGGLYHQHPTKVDIAGTVESINAITPDELYACYNTFYSPSNMALFVVGDLDFQELMDCVTNTLQTHGSFSGDIKRDRGVEPKEVFQSKVTEKMEVSIPMFTLAFKDDQEAITSGKELLKRMMETEILLDILFKKGSSFHEDLYDKKWIFSPLSCDYSGYQDYGYAMISGETREVDQVVEVIFQRLADLRENGISQEAFQRIRKSRLGGFIKSFDSMEYIAGAWLNLFFMDISLMDFYDVLMNLRIEDVQNRLKTFFRREFSALSVIEPLAK